LDRARVSGDAEYGDAECEVGYLARKLGLSTDQLREPIKKHGNSRETLEQEGNTLGNR